MKKTVRSSSDAFLGRVVGHPAGFAFVNPIPGGADAAPNPTLKVDSKCCAAPPMATP